MTAKFRYIHLLFFSLLALFVIAGCGQDNNQPQNGGLGSTQPRIIESAPRTASISGEIGVPSGIDACGVMVYAEGTSHMAITDSEGRYTISGLPVGSFNIRAMRDDLESLVIDTIEVSEPDLDADQPFTRLLRTIMDEKTTIASSRGRGTGSIVGTVSTNAPGDEVGVTVSLEGTRYRTVTISGGVFEFPTVEPGNYELVFTKQGFADLRQTIKVVSAQETRVDVVNLSVDRNAAQRERMIVGRIDMLNADDSSGGDFSSVRVVLEGTSYITTPDSTGRFQLRNLGAGRYIISASAPGYLLAQKFEIDLTYIPVGEVNLQLVEDTTSQAGSSVITGRVLLENAPGGRNSGVAVSLAGTNLIGFTTDTGDYRIENVGAGTYDLVAMFTGYKTGYIENFSVDGLGEVVMDDLTLEQDIERPRVVYTDPRDGTDEVPIEQPTTVMIQFSEKMDVASVTKALRISPEVDYSLRSVGSSPGAQDTFIMSLNAIGDGGFLKYDTRYRVSIASSAKSSKDIEMEEDYEFSFTTGEAMIIATRPEDGEKEFDYQFNQPIEIYFNAPIDYESITMDDIRFRPELPGKANLRFRKDPETGWSIMMLDGRGEMDEDYKVSIRRGVSTVSGSRVKNVPYTFSFRTYRYKTYDEVYRDNRNTTDDRDRERERNN